MGEAYLDWQKKSAGIKLNDVIEEYRYVAAGQRVKAGDLLVFAGEDVAPATEPPFNAIALSSGVGGTDTEHNEQVKIARVYKEVIKTGNIVPASWTYVSDTEYIAENGTIIRSSGYNSSTLDKAFDGDNSTYFIPARVSNTWVELELPPTIKASKVVLVIEGYGGLTDFKSYKIQGSNNGNDWVDIYVHTEVIEDITTLEIDLLSYFRYCRLDCLNDTGTHTFKLHEFQTSEYVEVI